MGRIVIVKEIQKDISALFYPSYYVQEIVEIMDMTQSEVVKILNITGDTLSKLLNSKNLQKKYEEKHSEIKKLS